MAPNFNSNDRFGSSVSLSGDTLLVGAYLESSQATGVNGNQNDNNASGAGAVYAFRRVGGLWNLEAYLKASNTDALDNFGHNLDLFGECVAVDADRILVACMESPPTQVKSMALSKAPIFTGQGCGNSRGLGARLAAGGAASVGGGGGVSLGACGSNPVRLLKYFRRHRSGRPSYRG